MTYRVVIELDEDGMFVAECPALPGCISQGKTRDEALANIKDAMTGYLFSVKKHNEPLHPFDLIHSQLAKVFRPKGKGAGAAKWQTHRT